MNDVYIPLISGFVGALIGALASIITVWLQAKTSDRRERLRHAADLALADYRLQLELANKSGQKFAVPPVVLFLHYHLGLMKLMESGELNEVAMRVLADENERFYAVIKELNEDKSRA